MQLISLSTFVLEKNEFGLFKKNDEQIRKYAEFLQKDLDLSMFIPCDKDGVPLKEPSHLERMQAGWADNPIDDNFYRVRDYNDAKKEVLFAGFEVNKQGGEYLVKYNDSPVWVNWNYSKKIEDLIYLNIQCAVSF